MITFYVPFLGQKLIYSREVRHFFPFLKKPWTLFENAGARANIEKSAETPSWTVLSVTAAIFIWKEDGGKVHWMNIKKIYVLFSKKNSFLYKNFWKLPFISEKQNENDW